MSDNDFYARYLGAAASSLARPEDRPTSPEGPARADARHADGASVTSQDSRPDRPANGHHVRAQAVHDAPRIGAGEARHHATAPVAHQGPYGSEVEYRVDAHRPVTPRHVLAQVDSDDAAHGVGSQPEKTAQPSTSGQHASASVGPLRANIRAADLVKPYKEIPETGWRKAVYRTTRINLGLSPAERAWNDLHQRVTRNLRGTYLVAVVQQKGGVSKTTVTVGLGSALARYRDDKVAAIDANPASGNLTKRVSEPSTGTWRGLINDQRLESYSDFRHYLGKNSSGLDVLASDRGDQMLTGTELTELWRRLQRQYPIGLLDCGTQLRDDVMAAVLSVADAVVVVSTTRLDGADAAAETLNWLVDHGYPHLVRSAVIVISDINRTTPSSSVQRLYEQFEKAVRAVHHVPFDPHLSDAAAIDFDRLRPQTRRVLIEAAASLVDGFAAAADKDPGALSGPLPAKEVR